MTAQCRTIEGCCMTHDREYSVCFQIDAAVKAEREACAKLAEDYGTARYHYEAEPGRVKQDAMTAAKAVATLIRGREET